MIIENVQPKVGGMSILRHLYRLQSEGDNVLGSVRPIGCLSVLSRLNRLTHDLEIWYIGWPWPWLGWDCIGQSQVPKIVFWLHCYLALRSKVGRQGQRSRSNSGTQRSILGARFCQVQQSRVVTSLRCLCVCNQCQWAYAGNSMDAVNRLLIMI